jgi:hypothetical protein
MVGEIKKEDYISATNARVGDAIVLAVDFDGKVARANNFYWDTVTFKTSDEVRQKRKAMTKIAQLHIVNASKDISNGGIFGSILQMSKYSNVGADINLNSIIMPPELKGRNTSLLNYSKMYLTTSFILSVPLMNCDKVIDVFRSHGIDAMIIGNIIKPLMLKIRDQDSSIEVIKY